MDQTEKLESIYDFEDIKVPKRDPSLLSSVLGVCTGLTCVAIDNASNKIPLLSRFPRYVIGGVSGLAFGWFIEYSSTMRMHQHDQYVLEYVRRHPEDFPEVKRKKIGEIIESWYAVR